MSAKAPVKATGGAGYGFEDQCAAFFLLDLLAARALFGAEFGPLVRIDFQVRESGWLFDDFLLTCLNDSRDMHVAVSAKSGKVVTQHGFPLDFVSDVWRQWYGTGGCPFRRDKDLLTLLVGEIGNDVRSAWHQFLSEASQADPARVAARFSTGDQSSQLARNLFASLRCPPDLQELGEQDDIATVRLAKHVRLLYFDFQLQPSNEEADAHQKCRSLLESGGSDEATRLWRRLIGIASEQRKVGGTLELPKLLGLLRTEFTLKDHPDYAADWSRLAKSSKERITGVRNVVGEGLRLDRQGRCDSIAKTLLTMPIVALVGESGVGKSVIARHIAEQSNALTRVIWLDADAFDCPDDLGVRQRLAISHSLSDICGACPSPNALLVLDGIDRFSPDALRNAARLISSLSFHDGQSPGIWRLMLTSEVTGWQRVLLEFSACEVDLRIAKVESIQFPEPDEIDNLLSRIPSLRILANRRELGILLRNLKILDFVARSGQFFGHNAPSSWTTESDVFNWLWDYWTDTDSDCHARSALLKKVGEEEGSSLAASIATASLDQADSQMLGQLEQRHLLRVQDERIRFAHDLIGDLARLRVLIGANHDAQAIRDRVLQPRWHRAVRLYGLRLLEQREDGVSRWQQAIARFPPNDDASVIARDLLLEAPVYSVNADRLLEQTWPVLTQGDALLLYRLLKTFLHSCTIPDPRIPLLVETPSDVGLYASFMRLPDGPHWLPVLRLLHRHVDDVVSKLGLFTSVAKVCSLWLRSTPIEIAPGHKFPGRLEAATLAFAMAHEVQCRKIEHVLFTDDVDKHVYEAALLGAIDLPDEVSELSLQLARRREPSEKVRARIDSFRRSEQERQRKLASDPEYTAKLARVSIGLGPVTRGRKRKPWPDGPFECVDNAFQELCLENAVAFQALIHARPNIAREILLAVCIEPPPCEHPFGHDSILDHLGTEMWLAGHPPMFFRGPFLQFLRAAPMAALDAILTLVNFATHRWADSQVGHARRSGRQIERDDLAVGMTNGDSSRRWLGDARVYAWYRNPGVSAGLVVSSLMALEKWFYEEVDADRDIGPWVELVLRHSESVAFAGVLVAVGLRTPSLFEGPLLPLLGTWQLFNWHEHLLLNGTVWQTETMSWTRLGERLSNVARAWHLLPHRKKSLLDLGVSLMLTRLPVAEFFTQVRRRWQQDLENTRYRDSVELSIARFNPENYRRAVQPDGPPFVWLEWPEPIRQRVEAALRVSQQSLATMNFPVQCRMILDGERALPDADVDAFWAQLQAILGTTHEDEHQEVFDYVTASKCGGIAVLITNHVEWLHKNPEKLTWCREQLMVVIESPPARSQLECAESLNPLRWDGFVAEALVAFLSIEPSQANVRVALATLVTGFYYSTTGIAMKAAFRFRDRLGEDFVRLQNLAVMWSGIRSVIQRASVLELDCTRWHGWRKQLIEVFENRWISCHAIAWVRIGRIAGLALHRIEKQRRRFSDLYAAELRDTPNEDADWFARRRRRSRLDPGLDVQLLQSAFDWLPPLNHAHEAAERIAWVRLLKNALDVMISSFNGEASDDDNDEVDGTPYEYDLWVLQKLAIVISQMRPDEYPEQLWQPVLTLGPPAHYWVSSFLADWFVLGTRAAQSPTLFVDRWKQMVQWAFASNSWTASKSLGYRLADFWIELMGLGGQSSVLDNEEFQAALVSLADQYRLFAKRWMRFPRVASAFARFLARPTGVSLRLSGLSWLADVVHAFDPDDWRSHELESNLIDALRACWLTNSNQLRLDQGYRATFFALLGKLMERQNQAAYELRDEVLRNG